MLLRSAALLILVAGCAGAQPYSDVRIVTGDAPGVHLSSGLVVCDEALRDGRWVTRYWNNTGVTKRDSLAEAEMRLAMTDSFELALDGTDLAGGWRWVKATSDKTERGTVATVELQNERRPVRVRVRTLLTGSPVLVRWLEIVNEGQKSTGITRVSPWSGLLWNTPYLRERVSGGGAFEVATTSTQDQLQEGSWRWETLGDGSRTVSGTRGKSGWGHPTFFARNRGTGEWFVASLGWSGNWTMRLQSTIDSDGNRARLSFTLGPAAADPVLRVVAPGETVKTPETHVLTMRGSQDDVIQALHTHVRRHVFLPAPAGREHQVEANHRGYIVDREDEAGLKREIDIAAAIGAEMFVIDAGWFGPSPNRWYLNAGDWYAGDWLPNDLHPVREHARRKGMLFGLWVELEGMGPVTKLAKEHPDWATTRDGKPIDSRHLDFSRPEVAAWAEAEVVRLIDKYKLDMFRIDYNMTIHQGGNRVVDGMVENTLWRHVEALYGIFERVHQRFPNVILQNCASGGGRLDFGILSRFHNTELSDFLRAPRTLKIFNGMTWVLPPEYLLRTFGTETGGMEADADLDTQLRQALMARPIFRGIAPSLEEFNPLLRQKLSAEVERFKKSLRPLMVGSVVYHHTPLTPVMEPAPWVVIEYARPARERSGVWVFRTSADGDGEYVVRPRGLDAGRNYRVTLLNSGQTFTSSGRELMQDGWRVSLDSNLLSEVLLFDAVR